MKVWYIKVKEQVDEGVALYKRYAQKKKYLDPNTSHIIFKMNLAIQFFIWLFNSLRLLEIFIM